MAHGPYIDDDGNVISSNLSSSEEYGDGYTALRRNFQMMPGQIRKIYTVDDAQNMPGLRGFNTLCDVIVFHQDGVTEIVRRCVLMQPTFGGGLNNFFEVIPTDPGPAAKSGKMSAEFKRGSFVLVGFINGQKNAGVVLGALPHSNKVAVSRRPKKSKGTYMEYEFQGMNFQYRNDGSYKVTFNGPRNDKGVLTGTNGPTSMEFDKNGNFTILTNANQTVDVNRIEKTIRIANGATSMRLEQDGNKVSIEGDDVNLYVHKDLTAFVDGKAKIAATGEATVSSEAKINLARGQATPGEPFVLGKKFVKFMKDVLKEISQIKHLGNLGAPTPPPLNAAKFTALADQAEELLSELIVGDK